jgi:two-component system phosphate regulon sensor histidine kinase PhoR
MESSVQSESFTTDGAHRFSNGHNGESLAILSREIGRLNTIGKRFVASIDRFQVHRALLAALQDLYSFSVCCILLKGEPYELFIIPCYPLSPSFFEAMIQRIASAAKVIDFQAIDATQLARTAYLDAPDELAQPRDQSIMTTSEIGSSLNIPLSVENRIIGLLSLFDEKEGSFDTELLQITAVIADYAAIALENVRLRERETALWRQAEFERQRLELIIRSMAEGLLITDMQGRITSQNDSARQLLVAAQADFKRDLSLRVLAATSSVPWLPRLADIIEQALTSKVVTNQELIVGQTGENIPLTLSISAAPLHDANSKSKRPIGVVAVLNDVTSIKQVEHMKDEFVSVVSHELRTPLTAIKGYTQHLMRRIERRIRKYTGEHENAAAITELPESYDLRSLSIIQSQTDHLERLVNDLLDLSQMQWGQWNLSFETFYLADLLVEQVRSVQASAEQHTIYLDIAVQDSKIEADRIRIGQVVGNILDNAVKYSPQGGQVMVRLQEQNGDYLISIMDQGVGVSAEHLDHIFERFYRVHNTASHQYTGIGLGLYVAKAIIEGHGGQIWFTSTPGSGSTFHFTLPHKPRS